ncbi:MAG: DUF1573 domain-containing protein [Ekhidna sp.]
MRLAIFLVITSINFFSFGQSSIKFEVVDHDFGEIREEDGFAEYTFNFVNSGDKPVKITQVKASCGCTTPGWTKEEVMPGDSGFVKARYNPRNRPGKFRKSLRISTSDPASDQTLYIMGMVKPKPKTPEEEYPIVAGEFRLKYRGLNMGKVTTEKPVSKTFDIYNPTDSTLFLRNDGVVPSHISVSLADDSLAAGQSGKLVVSYDPIAKDDYGFVSDNVKLSASDEEGVSVMAVIEEFFSPMTADELDEAPKLEISDRVFDFGSVEQGAVIETAFELTNRGKKKLEFRAIKSNCGCLTYEMKKSAIKKGKTETLNVSFDTSDMRGNQYKAITIYSNDPVNPTQLVTIKGTVKAK